MPRDTSRTIGAKLDHELERPGLSRAPIHCGFQMNHINTAWLMSLLIERPWLAVRSILCLTLKVHLEWELGYRD
jgi:hypothetical protein